MNTKWINGIEEGIPIKIDEKRNAGDGGGDKTKIKRIIATKVSTHKESEKLETWIQWLKEIIRHHRLFYLI